jgi:phosphoglucosamine mutase
MQKLFGTDGIRGEAGVFPLDKNTISIIGKSLAQQFNEKLGRNARFVIGRDTRESGTWIENAFCAGAMSEGAFCSSAEIITTPGVAFLTKSLDFDAGIVISASHNPFEDNGIKIFLPSGAKLDSASERKIEADIFGEKNKANLNGLPPVTHKESRKFQDLYLNYLSKEFKDLSLTNLKMVIDCANGASSNLAQRLFEKFGAETVVINDEPDGRNINKDCGSLHIDNLQKKVIEEKADFGVAFDGDADRSLFVDENGAFVDGDSVLWVMAQHLQAIGELVDNSIVATVMSNIGLELALNSRNIKLLRTPVGDKYVLQALLDSGISVGGEQSGHIIFPKKSLVGDGMFTTLYLLEALQTNNKSLSQMNKGFTQFPQILVNVKVRKKVPFENDAEISNAAKRIEQELGEKGRLLLRYSGTEYLARIMIEGECQAEIEKQANQIAKIIETRLG